MNSFDKFVEEIKVFIKIAPQVKSMTYGTTCSLSALVRIFERYKDDLSDSLENVDSFERYQKQFRQIDMVDCDIIDMVIWDLLGSSPILEKCFNSAKSEDKDFW